MCNWFKRRLEQDLPKQECFKINIYISETTDSILVDSDIIISTTGSAGTGTDIKNLKTMLMTIATGSDVINKQSLGRLRELPSGEAPIYVYAWCRDIVPHCNYQTTREKTYSIRGRTFREITLG
jgi:hypothetical protein